MTPADNLSALEADMPRALPYLDLLARRYARRVSPPSGPGDPFPDLLAEFAQEFAELHTFGRQLPRRLLRAHARLAARRTLWLMRLAAREATT